MQITLDFTGEDPEVVGRVMKAIAKAYSGKDTPVHPHAHRGFGKDPATYIERIFRWAVERDEFGVGDVREAFPEVAQSTINTYLCDLVRKGRTKRVAQGRYCAVDS